MGICQREGDTATWRAGLAFSMSVCLQLRDQDFETMMGLVDLAREIRKVRVQVNLCTGEFSVASVAAHLQQLHPTAFQFGQHQVPHRVRGQLRQMQRVSEAVKNVLYRPFANGLARIALRGREKNGTIPIGTMAPDEGSSLSLDVLFEAAPGRMRGDDSARQFVFCDLGPDGNGMRAPIDIVDAQQRDLLPTKGAIMR